MKNKIKGAVILLVIMAVAFTAYGCGKSDSQTDASIVPTVSAEEVSEEVNFGFELIYDGGSFEFYREISTDTMYVYSYKGRGYGGGAAMTAMPNPETGKALTYTDWVENYKNK